MKQEGARYKMKRIVSTEQAPKISAPKHRQRVRDHCAVVATLACCLLLQASFASVAAQRPRAQQQRPVAPAPAMSAATQQEFEQVASQAAAAQASNSELAARAQKEAERYAKEEEEISKTAKELERRGFRVYPLDFSEFMKAGGAAKCLVLKI